MTPSTRRSAFTTGKLGWAVSGCVRNAAAAWSVMVPGSVCTSFVITSLTRVNARGSMQYFRTIWCPQRAIFSVRIERRMSRTVTACAAPQEAITGSSICVLPVNSTAKKVAVNGERIVPPMVAAMASSGQKPGDASGIKPDATAPIAPPMMSKGARTPPDVPEPSAADQMIALTTSRSRAALGRMSPCTMFAILSYPTPSA